MIKQSQKWCFGEKVDYLTKKEIKSLKIKDGFLVKRDLFGEWVIEIQYQNDKLLTIRTKRGELRTFKKMDAVVNFLNECDVKQFTVFT